MSGASWLVRLPIGGVRPPAMAVLHPSVTINADPNRMYTMSSGCRLSSCAVGIAQWNGEPRGRWEGNTLVVESRYFPDRPADRFRHIWRAPASTLHVVERFTRVGAETIDYAATITDPVRFARPWTVRFVLSNDPAGRG